MGEVINIQDILPLAKKESKESDLAMFAVLYFSEYFAKLYSDVDIEVRYALVISIYRYMADAEKEGAVEINEEGFSISPEASEDLHEKIKKVIDFGEAHLKPYH